MASQIQWRGVFPALTTKFKAGDSLDFEAMAAHLEFQLEAGVHGIIILGSLGENSTLDMAEKLEMVAFFREHIGDRAPLIACIAESGTREALHFLNKASEAGAEGFMLLPPMRYASDDRETLHYLRTIGLASTRPIMLYNNPVAYGTDISPADFAGLGDVETFEAIKESAADPRRIADIRRLCGERYALFCGVDNLALECFLLGACGWVAGLAVALPRETVRLYDLMAAGDWEAARQWYAWFLPLLHLDIGPKFVQQIKLVEALHGVGSARVRAPRLELDESEQAQVREVYEQAMATRPDA